MYVAPATSFEQGAFTKLEENRPSDYFLHLYSEEIHNGIHKELMRDKLKGQYAMQNA